MALTKEQIKTEYPLPVYNYRVEIGPDAVAFSEVSGLNIAYETTTFKESPVAGGAPGPRVMYMPGQATMKINTAIGLGTCGLALLACQWRRTRGGPASGLLSLFVMALGLATMAQFVWGIDLGIDTLAPDAGAQAQVIGELPVRLQEAGTTLQAVARVAPDRSGLAIDQAAAAERGSGVEQYLPGIEFLAIQIQAVGHAEALP